MKTYEIKTYEIKSLLTQNWKIVHYQLELLLFMATHQLPVNHAEQNAAQLTQFDAPFLLKILLDSSKGAYAAYICTESTQIGRDTISVFRLSHALNPDQQRVYLLVVNKYLLPTST